ncbi:hypothetical protein [Streptosporangium sp. KLBMP 9127]|nr:hypothetical protein [Streptosporangium sp. KLBMP 9127]
MPHQPYTYVTVSLRPDKAPRVGVSFNTHDVRVCTLTTGGTRPYLDLTTREANVSISTSGAGPVTDQDVTLAREIFNAAARYLADCERLNTTPTTSTGPVDQTAT